MTSSRTDDTEANRAIELEFYQKASIEAMFKTEIRRAFTDG